MNVKIMNGPIRIGWPGKGNQPSPHPTLSITYYFKNCASSLVSLAAIVGVFTNNYTLLN